MITPDSTVAAVIARVGGRVEAEAERE